MKVCRLIISLVILNLNGYFAFAQQPAGSVRVVGQMKDVMWKGELGGKIHLDTIPHRSSLYGMGPVENLRGEILVMGGKFYKSTVVSETTMKVEETDDIRAPFFGYANISKWKEQPLPDSVKTVPQLESYLHKLREQTPRPFLFRLSGTIELASIHIVNLPAGAKVSSPDDAHQGQVSYQLNNEKVEILGFFSTAHQAVFTHHDTYLHMHLITADRQKMGHLDEVLFGKGEMKLLLPEL